MSNHEQLLEKLKKSKPAYYAAVVAYNPVMDAVLLGHRREDGIWTSPAGGANRDEAPEDCIVREAWEEAQLEIDKSKLIPIGVKTAPNGKPVHCYAYVTAQQEFSVSLDPDREVPKWEWYSIKDLPDGLRRQKNQNRLQTINEALMYLKGLKKSAAKERTEKIDKILKLKGKLGAGENYSAYISSLTDEKIQALHDKLLGICEEKVEKSVTAMSHVDVMEIDTAKYSVERENCDSDWLERFFQGMEGFDFGDVPREFALDKGTLFLSKVDDGLYSGYFKRIEEVEDGQLEENAKVRIEKQTLPTLVNFITAKEWISPKVDPYQALSEKLSEVQINEPAELEPVPMEESNLDKKIRVLELMTKLLG